MHLLVLVAASAAPGCGNAGADGQATAPGPAEPAERVAALLPFAADQLLAMGVRPVAVPGLAGDMPATWAGIPGVAMDHSAGPNLEQLIAVGPDLIITGSVYAQFVPAMERTTGARVVVMDVDSVESVAEHITLLGDLCGRAEDAAALTSAIREAETPPAPGPALRTLAIFGTPHAFYAFLPDSYLGDLVERAGGWLITGDMESHPVFRGLAPLSMEAVIERDPELILVVFHGAEASARAMMDRDPLWSGLDAVRTGAVVYLRDDLYAMRPGSELARAREEIGEIVALARGVRP